jgi:protein involved in polysaccharide export with SLBB domain
MRNDKRTAAGRLLCLVLALFASQIIADRILAQTNPDLKTMELIQRMQSEKTDAGSPQVQGIALESPVNPEHYYVGPSDVISVNIWMSPPQNYPLSVTPEGTLIIPTVGEVSLSDLSLARAKEKILAEVRKKYISVNVSVTLLKPRPIVVSIVGTVLNPGLITVTAVDRANKVIDEANKPTRLQSEDALRNVLESMSMRNIRLEHRDGSEDRVDLKKYYATRDDKLNPYLREGDIIVVPTRQQFTNVVAVYGQVNTNGRFEFVQGDSLTDAIKIANGLTDHAHGEEAVLSRQSDDGRLLEERKINIPAILAGKEANFALEPGDRIIVKANLEARADLNVDVHGAVRFPGTYPIGLNRTRLSEVIRQAGGFTPEASLGGARLLRHEPTLENSVTEQILNMRGGVANEETTGFALESGLRTLREAVTVDFVKLFHDGDSTQDVILRGEDKILVPTQVHTVYVFGQVALPGHVPFIEGKNLGYYIGKSGGYTDRANSGQTKIIKSGTKQWLDPSDTKIEEGDYVWVPTEIDRPFGYYLAIVSQSAAILSVAISLAILVSQTK